MELFAKTKEELFLKQIGRKLVDTRMFGPREILEDEKEQGFYLNLKKPEISIPILEGYEEKAEEEVFADYNKSDYDYQKAGLTKEAVRALSLIRKIAEGEKEKGLISKVNEKIISIGDRVNKARPEYALEETTYGIDFSAVPFAYNHADGTTERKLETAEWVIESDDYLSDLKENILALYSGIGEEYAQRIAEKLSERYLKPKNEENLERVLEITKALYGNRKNLFNGMGEFLDKELFARVKYPDSRIAKTDEGIIVIPKDEEKIVVINGGEKEVATQSA